MFCSQNRNNGTGGLPAKSVTRLNKTILTVFLLISVTGGAAYPQKGDKPSLPQQERKNDKVRADKTSSKVESPDFSSEKRFAQGLLETIGDRAKAGGNEIDTELAERAYYALRDSLPLFQRLQPERTGFVEEQMRALLGFMSPQDANRAGASNHDTVDELVRKAESTIGERRRTIAFMRASAAALSEGNVERAVEIANRIDDLYERKIQTSLVLYQAASKQLREGKLERAYDYAKGIEFLPQRTAMFHRIAQRMWKDKEPDHARATMEEIWDWLDKTENTPQKADAMLKLTATMSQHDTERGFEFLQSTVRALNRTDFSSKLRDPNRLTVELQIMTDMLDIDSSFTTPAGRDFERSRTIAGLLTNPELALLAQAIVCRQVLAAR